jgi:peptidoglycan/xylan/chitin deacetylase (PgdA/CDA1 family)
VLRARGLTGLATVTLLAACAETTLTPGASTPPAVASAAPTVGASRTPAATASPPAATGAPIPGGPSQLVEHGDRSLDEVALTFTVGYRLDPAIAILESLRERGGSATIFMSGVVLDRDETRATARRALAIISERPDLFQLGQHGYAATELSQLDADGIESEILDAERAIGRYVDEDLRPYFSPPGGAWSPEALAILGRLGYATSVLWDVDPLDWLPPADGGPSTAEIVDRVLGKVQGGSIVLLHLGGWNTAEALPAILDGLTERGLRTVTVADLLNGD